MGRMGEKERGGEWRGTVGRVKMKDKWRDKGKMEKAWKMYILGIGVRE